MATTSIWRVKGWLGKIVIYIENPDKTENPAFYEKADMTERQAQGLSDVIDYAVNSEKTQAGSENAVVMQQFVSGVNCHPATAREEMIAVKKRFGLLPLERLRRKWHMRLVSGWRSSFGAKNIR